MNPTIRSLTFGAVSGAATLGFLALAPMPRADAVALCGPAPIDVLTVFAPGFACQVGNAIVDQFTTAFVLPAGTTGSAAFAFFDDIYDADFNVNPANNFTPPVDFAYRFTLLDPSEFVVGVALDVNGNGVRTRPATTSPGTYGGTLSIRDLSSTLVASLSSTDGVRDPVGVDFTPLPGLNSTLVEQRVFTDPQLPSGIRPTINNVSQQFITERRVDTVPGPLPILGALGAYGWSRRLRRRINAA